MKKYIALVTFLVAFSSAVNAQTETPYGMSEIQAYSIFYENYRTGDYEMAIQFGRWMIDNKPMTIEGNNRFSLPTQFDRMITAYSKISEEQTDPTLKSAYLDTAEAIFTDAFETFDEETIDFYEWHLDRGRFYQQYSDNIEGSMEKAYADYEAAYELDPERFTNAGDGYYVRVLLSNYTNTGERDKALAMIETVEPHAGSDLLSSINQTRNELFSNPEERIVFLEEQFEKNPEDEALISEIAKLYEDMGNRAKAIEYAEILYNANDNFENTRRLADYALADAQTSKAIQYLREALDKAESNQQKRGIALELAVTYQNADNLQTARQYARQAIQFDSNWGQPYIRIASIYARAVSQCTSGRTIERDDRTVYWLVLDNLDKAQQVDSSTASTVRQNYRSYEPVAPTSEDKFFRGWETGDSVTIGSNISECYAWINETTTVR